MVIKNEYLWFEVVYEVVSYTDGNNNKKRNKKTSSKRQKREYCE